MNKSKLIELLSERDEEDVLIEIDGTAYEIKELGHCDEEFDGFFTAYPAAVTLIPIKDD